MPATNRVPRGPGPKGIGDEVDRSRWIRDHAILEEAGSEFFVRRGCLLHVGDEVCGEIARQRAAFALFGNPPGGIVLESSPVRVDDTRFRREPPDLVLHRPVVADVEVRCAGQVALVQRSPIASPNADPDDGVVLAGQALDPLPGLGAAIPIRPFPEARPD